LEILRVHAFVFTQMANLSAHAAEYFRGLGDDQPDLDKCAFYARFLGSHLDQCNQAGLSVTSKQINRMLEALTDKSKMARNSTMASGFFELYNRLEDELTTKLFFQIPGNRRTYFDSPRDGWEEVIARFPDTVTDIEEMGKCFALSRYAGAVFHSVNAIEGSLLELGKFLKVEDPLSGWTAVSKKLEQLVLKTKFPDLDPIFQRHFLFLEQTHGTVVALKNSWRNKISHTHGKLVLMTSDFNPDVAEEIMITSRSFMRRLATEMPT
jgi:hypothetical protein